jgi:hypothetical protein
MKPFGSDAAPKVYFECLGPSDPKLGERWRPKRSANRPAQMPLSCVFFGGFPSVRLTPSSRPTPSAAALVSRLSQRALFAFPRR